MKTKILERFLTFCIFGLTAGALLRPSTVLAGTYVVNTTDSRFEEGSSPCSLSHCSLWEAVESANLHSGPDRITFAIPGDGPHVIVFRMEWRGLSVPAPGLFVSDNETEIDATTQPGWPVYLHGLGTVMTGLTLYSDRNTVRGLGFLGFYNGISVLAESENNFIDRVVAGDFLDEGFILAPFDINTGILLSGDNNTVRGASITNTDTGIWLKGSNETIEDSHIGFILGSASRNGNRDGIRLNGSGNTIQRNVIMGNSEHGIWALSNGNIIIRNRIGLDYDGLLYGNRVGINLTEVGGNRVGGTDLYEGNIIVGNDYGMTVYSPGNQILNNRIGTDFSGSAFPNRVGVLINYTSDGTVLGSGWYGAGNIIAYNTEEGVLVSSASQVVIEQNTIHHNGGDGIRLATEIDIPADGMKITIRRNSIYENGGLGINIPDPAFVNGLGAPESLRYLSGTVSGTACPGCIIDVYKAAADPTGAGEGKTHLESARASGDGSFSVSVPGLRSCNQITATATDALGNTSVFSHNAVVSLCFRLPIFTSWVIIIGAAAAGGGAALLILVRRRPLTLRRAPWLLLGAALGIGAAILFFRLPFVQILWPSPQSPSGSGQPQFATQSPAIFTESPPVFTQGPPIFTPTVAIAASPTATGTQSSPTATLLANANCRRGAGADYSVVTTLSQGSVVPIVGRNPEGGWWQVQVPGTQTQCWIAGENADTAGDTSGVPVVQSPPLGCWVWTGNKNECKVPCPEGAEPGGACEP